MICVQYLRERATVTAKGECCFKRNVDGRWLPSKCPSVLIARLALAVRETAYPLLPRMSVYEITGEGTGWTTEEILNQEG